MRYWQNIMEIIEQANEHLSAEEVFFVLKKERPDVVIATVYNNLNRLYEKGKIRRISIAGQPDRYDRNTRHDHLVCSHCGKICDIQLANLTEELEKQVGFAIEGYELRIKYVCSQCARNAESHESQYPMRKLRKIKSGMSGEK